MEHYIDAWGNLVLAFNCEVERDWFRDRVERGECLRLSDLLDASGLLGNGWHEISPEDVGALTNADMVSDGVDHADDGSVTVYGDIWYWAHYALRCPVAEAVEDGYITLTLARELPEDYLVNKFSPAA